MATQSIAPIDHAALDAIMSRLEHRYGLDPRLDRAFRLFMGQRVEISEADPTAALVHGESGRSYWATVNGFCECPDAANGHTCKHQLATKIAVQLRAVEQAKATPADDIRAQCEWLCLERSQLGARLCAQGLRPIDDPTWVEFGEWIAALRSQIAAH
jgi:hypothetical protein